MVQKKALRLEGFHNYALFESFGRPVFPDHDHRRGYENRGIGTDDQSENQCQRKVAQNLAAKDVENNYHGYRGQRGHQGSA
jgi:hypothetical protein